MTARQTRPRPGVMALATAVVLSLALTGCGGGDDAKPSVTTTAASSASAVSASPADPDAAEKAAVLASYTSMWVEQMKAYRVASPDGTKLDDFATLDALSAFERDLAHMKKNHTVIRGELGHQPEVTDLDVDAKLPTATVEDCIDLSKWQTLDTKTNKPIPLPTAQPLRYVATATVERWDDNRWMVTEYQPDGTRTC
ncbi:hypothetical protein D7Y56_01280 (plasmid) [Streptomyces sp. S501]|uniref:hypothetical protein n=1 Tax=Streptomyces sp. S501 TaxID=2420135 RepID=UPI00106E8002|nr:hypothetical protein [Streptomyces sp. S501]QBR04674.1 hypothetical protein D7Y56_01280 [Streptomyces sp. S501]